MANEDNFGKNYEFCMQYVAGLKTVNEQLISDSKDKTVKISSLEQEVSGVKNTVEIKTGEYDHLNELYDAQTFAVDFANGQIKDLRQEKLGLEQKVVDVTVQRDAIQTELDLAVQTIDAEIKKYAGLQQNYGAMADKYKRVADCLTMLVNDSDLFRLHFGAALESFDENPDVMDVVLRAFSTYLVDSRNQITSLSNFKEDATVKMANLRKVFVSSNLLKR